MKQIFLFFCSLYTQVIFGQSKPNIVFIITDDQTYTAIHALGNKEIITPNIDKLVKMGTSFTNAHNMGAWHGAVCVASRAMLLSGRTVWRAKDITASWAKGDSIEKTWGQLMQQGGYTTYMTGKWHVDASPEKVFNVVKDVKPGMAEDYWHLMTVDTPSTEEIKQGKTIQYHMPVGYNRPLNEDDHSWSPYDTSFGGYWQGGKHWSLVLKDDALSFIETAKKKDEPFFMYIASNAPHDPRQAPKEYLEQYDLNNITLPKSWLPEYPYKDAIDNGPSLRDEALAPFPRTAFAIKTHIREYYASITYLDEQIGAILHALEQSGKMNNTYIFFTSDHGLAMGRHGLMGKQSLYEHSVKPPLILVGPGIPANKIITTPVYMQDVMATALDVAGIAKPPYIEFHSLMNLAKGNSRQSPYTYIYGSYMNVERSIYKGDYKLILYPAIKKMLLFNLRADPEEMTDLSGSTQNKKLITILFNNLLHLQHSLGDQLDLTGWYKSLNNK
ncbi:MAG: sulfatase-like hydrolase/transferase [Agriterribacter sp.]